MEAVIAPRACRGEGTIRSATIADVSALSRLLTSAGIAERALTGTDVAAWLARGRLIVLDVGAGAVGAAAYAALDVRDGGVHARIDLFVVSPALVGTGSEDRMAAALLAVCENSGCIDIDVPPKGASRLA